jgi:DNA-binding CsgD family transcriptional regulator
MDIPKFESKAQENDFLKIRVESLGLPTRTENALLSANIRTIGGIVRKTEFSLLDIQGLGRSGLREIEIKLKDPNILLLVSNNLEESHDETPQGSNSNLPSFIKYTLKVLPETSFKNSNTLVFENKSKENDFYKTRTESIGLSTRFKNALINANIRTVGGIMRKTESSLLEIRGFGLKGIQEIKIKLSEYIGLMNFSSGATFKEQTEEDKIREYNNKKEVQLIEEQYFEKQEEKKFIYETKVISLGIATKIETILLSNNIFTVGDLLSEDIENIKEKYFLNDEDANSIIDIFNYLMSRNKQIEEGQEELRKKEVELIGHLNYQLEKKRGLISNEYIKISSRNLGIFNLFRKGLTLEQIGKENNITRERVRQVIKSTLDKIGLDHKEEKLKIYLKRNGAKPKKIIKEKTWSQKYLACKSCGTTTVPHFKEGLCEDCGGSSISGELREKIITGHNNKCDHCDISRDEAKIEYGRDFYLSRIDKSVLCKRCHLNTTGKKLGDSRKYKWKMFYK